MGVHSCRVPPVGGSARLPCIPPVHRWECTVAVFLPCMGGSAPHLKMPSSLEIKTHSNIASNSHWINVLLNMTHSKEYDNQQGIWSTARNMTYSMEYDLQHGIWPTAWNMTHSMEYDLQHGIWPTAWNMIHSKEYGPQTILILNSDPALVVYIVLYIVLIVTQR